MSQEECYDGTAFAFGGVEPGTLHAKGHAVKTHTVRYSVGVAGKYRLHVGLRQQGVPLPGSPFALSVSAGAAHGPMTRIRPEDLPLRGIVGEAGEAGEVGNGCAILVRAADRMGNFCSTGGAKLQVFVGDAQATRGGGGGSSGERLDAREGVKVNTRVEDKTDGTYAITFFSELSGMVRAC